MSIEDVVTVGKLGRPRGLHGKIYVTPDTDFLDRFALLKGILVHSKDGWEMLSVASAEVISGRPVLKFEGVDNPEQAARLTNRALGVYRSQIVSLPDDTYYVFDIVGCEVIRHDDGTMIGKIIDVERYPANDVYVIETDSEEIMRVPAVKQFVKNIDVQNKKIVIDPSSLEDQE